MNHAFTQLTCIVRSESSFVRWTLEQLSKACRHQSKAVRVHQELGTSWVVWSGDTPPDAPKLSDLKEDGYVLQGLKDGGFAIHATSESGLAYGILCLLKSWGYEHYFGGPVIPSKPWSAPLRPDRMMTHSPRLSVRGLQPFHNFLNGPTGWSVADYRSYFDTMAWHGFNTLLLHGFDYEPHVAYRHNGRWLPKDVKRDHARLRGPEKLAVSDFPKWARRHFEGKYFGPPDVLASETLAECIEVSQANLAASVEYAKARGVRTCVGLQLLGDPLVPEIRERFLSRLNHLVATYRPASLALWQRETGSVTGWELPLRGSGWERRWKKHEPTLKRLGAPRRGLELLRLAEFLNLAHKHLRRHAPDCEIVHCGWGGDDWMFLPEFFPVLDKLVPENITFSALDNIDVDSSKTVASGYGKLPKQRNRWPVIWLEGDAALHSSQWHAAANVQHLAPLVDDAVSKGCQGMLGIHWRFSAEVEPEMARFAKASWEEQSDSAFWTDFAKHCYGPKLAKPMAKQLATLDKLGPGWTGFSHRVECVPFSWESLPEVEIKAIDRKLWQALLLAIRPLRSLLAHRAFSAYKPLSLLDGFHFLARWVNTYGANPSRSREQLEAVRARLDELRAGADLELLPESGKQRLDDLITWIDFCLGYDRIARVMRRGGAVTALLAEAEAHLQLDAPEYASDLAGRALDLMRAEPLEPVIQLYAATVRSASQRANLAKMFTDALTDWNRTEARLQTIYDKKA